MLAAKGLGEAGPQTAAGAPRLALRHSAGGPPAWQRLPFGLRLGESTIGGVHAGQRPAGGRACSGI